MDLPLNFAYFLQKRNLYITTFKSPKYYWVSARRIQPLLTSLLQRRTGLSGKVNANPPDKGDFRGLIQEIQRPTFSPFFIKDIILYHRNKFSLESFFSTRSKHPRFIIRQVFSCVFNVCYSSSFYVTSLFYIFYNSNNFFSSFAF